MTDYFLTLLSVKSAAAVIKLSKTGSWLYLEAGWRHDGEDLTRDFVFEKSQPATANTTKGLTNGLVHYSSGSLNFSMSRKGVV